MTDEQAQAEYAAAANAGMGSDSNVAYVAIDSLGQDLLAEFNQAEMNRQETEMRWLKDLRQYRGIYEPEVAALIGKNRSKAFVRATRVKIKTVDARVCDLLFPTNAKERNWTADPTPIPSLDKETKMEVMKALGEALQRKPEKMEFDAACKKIVQTAADNMTRVMDDQLAESKYKATARKVLHSGHLYGTGVLKAPLVERKTRTKFVLIKGKWVMKTETYVVPFVDFVPIWRFYPDMAATELSQCRYVFERHLFTQADMVSLASRKSFKRQLIIDYIEANPDGMQTMRSFDSEIRQIGDRTSANQKDDGQYEVLERWGWITGRKLSHAGVKVPEDRMHETFFSNVWLFPNGQVIKVALQPINGVTWPYHLYYADKDETSIFADGFASVMRDDQEMINAGTRMVFDHAAITAGAQIEANMSLLHESENADEMYPFKIWKRNGKEPGSPAIRLIEVRSGLEELMPIINMCKENSDDVTAIPRFMQGENATQGAAGTASGMSMLMANASIVMKDLVTNYDEVTRTFIDSLYKWNMQFNPDNSCKGDFDIVARGTASLMAKELRAQQLDQFAAATANDYDAPFIKHEELLRQRAQAHDLNDVVKTEEEVQAEQDNDQAKQQAQIQQQMQDIQMKQAQLSLEKMQADIAKALADVDRIKAIAVKTNVDSAYAGMQAGGVATERPEIAPAGDAILKSSGWVDHTPQTNIQQEASMPQSAPVPQQAIAPSQAESMQQVQDQVAPQSDEDAQNEALMNAHMEGQDSNPMTPPSANVGANVGERAGMQTSQIEG